MRNPGRIHAESGSEEWKWEVEIEGEGEEEATPKQNNERETIRKPEMSLTPTVPRQRRHIPRRGTDTTSG